MQKIALRNDADKRPVVADHRQTALIGLNQQMRGVQQRRIGFDRCKGTAHNIRHVHGHIFRIGRAFRGSPRSQRGETVPV